MSFLDDLALWFHVIAELIAGSILIFQPLLFAPAPDGIDHVEALRGIGNGAFCIGVLGVCLLVKEKEERPRFAFGVIGLYHFGVVVLQLRHPLLGVPYWLAPGFHGLLLLQFMRAAMSARGSHKRRLHTM